MGYFLCNALRFASLLTIFHMVCLSSNAIAQNNKQSESRQKQLDFDAATILINRDYDQWGKIHLRNFTEKPIPVQVSCTSEADLICTLFDAKKNNVLAQTTLVIEAEDTIELAVLIHAHRVKKRSNTITVQALIQNQNEKRIVVATRKIPVNIGPAPLWLKTQWVEPTSIVDQARLVKILRITNNGLDIPDFAITFSDRLNTLGLAALDQGELMNKMILLPRPQYIVFHARSTIDIRVLPQLHTSFLELGGNLQLHGHKQYISIPFKYSVAESNHLFAAGKITQTVTETEGSFCATDSIIHSILPIRHHALLNLNLKQTSVDFIKSVSLVLDFESQNYKNIETTFSLQVYLNNQLVGKITNKQGVGHYPFSVPLKVLFDPQSGQMIKNHVLQLIPEPKKQSFKTYTWKTTMTIVHRPIETFLAASTREKSREIAKRANRLTDAK